MPLQTKALDQLVEQLNAHTKTCAAGTHAVVALSASVVINLGFDPKEPITRERLLKTMAQHFQRQLEDVDTAELLDSAEVIELRDES